jgi:hypothetical protein
MPLHYASCDNECEQLRWELKKARLRIAALQQQVTSQQAQIALLQAEKRAIQLKFDWAVELLAVPNKRVKSSTKLTLRRLVQDILPSATVDTNGYALIREASIYSGTGLGERTTRDDLLTLENWGILETERAPNGIRVKVKDTRVLANASYIGKVAPREARRDVPPRQLLLEISCPQCGSPRVLAHLSGICEECGEHFIERLNVEPEQPADEQPGECEQIAQALLFVERKQQKQRGARLPAPARNCARCGTRCWTWQEDTAGGWWDCGCLVGIGAIA